MTKPELEFMPVAKVDFTPCAGDVDGLVERVLATDEDTGVATRMLRFEPGVDTTPNGTQVHDFIEEVYILEGQITDLRLNQTFGAGEYACRPPGMPHGPWIAGDQGCLTFEVRYPSTPN